MTDRADVDDIRCRFREFADTTAARAPLYARLSSALADDESTARLLLHAPLTQRHTVLFFACVHWLLLTEPDHPDHQRLRRHYPNLVDRPTPDDPWPAFREFCAANEHRLAPMLAARAAQTNEIGRCAVFLPVFGAVGAEHGPLGLLDVGASGGLNLMIDRYRYCYTDDDGNTATVGTPSPVVLACGTRGAVPVPSEPPEVAERLGLDRQPIDVSDPDAAAWLRACVWPDQADRFARLSAAIELAAEDPPVVIRGDAVDDLASSVERLASRNHPVVTNSWVLSYLSVERQHAYVDVLDGVGADRDITWCLAESPAQTPGVPWPDRLDSPDLTHLLRVDWREGERTVRHLAITHPHGYWLHWS